MVQSAYCSIFAGQNRGTFKGILLYRYKYDNLEKCNSFKNLEGSLDERDGDNLRQDLLAQGVEQCHLQLLSRRRIKN